MEKAVDYATRAGDGAALSLAHEEAARFYEMARGRWISPGPVARRLRRGAAFTPVAAAPLKRSRQYRFAKQEFESALNYLDANAIEVRCELLRGAGRGWLVVGGGVVSVSNVASDALRLTEQLPGRSDLIAGAIRMYRPVQVGFRRSGRFDSCSICGQSEWLLATRPCRTRSQRWVSIFWAGPKRQFTLAARRRNRSHRA